MPLGRVPKILAQVEGVSCVIVNGYACAALTYRGVTKTLDEFATEKGIKKTTLFNRLAAGWSIEKSLETPPQRQEPHGKTGTVEWKLWMAMKQRCSDPNSKGYGRYGGRGIKVCPEWEKSFQAFLDHMGVRPSSKHTLERIDNAKGYEPGNVIWALPHVQHRNTRANVRLTFQGRTMILKDWAREFGLANTTLWNRLNTLGWSIERALTTPKRGRRE